jgi:hypothetical protein
MQVVQKYLGRWSIEVFFKEAQQRLGLGREQGHSFAAQVLAMLQACFRYSLLVCLLEQEENSKTIGEIFRPLGEETGKLTFLEGRGQHFSTFLATILNVLADFCDADQRFRFYLDISNNTFNQFSPMPGCKN